MPPAQSGHASTARSASHAADMDAIDDAAVTARGRGKSTPPLCPADDDAVSTFVKTKKDKHSFDYVWRTGLAGGLAGCAVRVID